jgi:hypothetical protein
MAQGTWHAYYFDTFDTKSPPARIAVIAAENEEEAGRIATREMGRSMRVNVGQPIWGAAPEALRTGETTPELR